jgi:hypothetical protein
MVKGKVPTHSSEHDVTLGLDWLLLWKAPNSSSPILPTPSEQCSKRCRRKSRRQVLKIFHIIRGTKVNRWDHVCMVYAQRMLWIPLHPSW